MQAYISISFNQRKSLDKVVKAIKETLVLLNIEPFVFVDNYNFDKTQEKEMMTTAFTEIAKADLIIAEVSDKAIGIGVEVGYATARGIPAIYVRNKTAEHSTTVSGACNHHILYQNEKELKEELEQLIKSFYLSSKSNEDEISF
jgi:2'-deoxynucleoside 5'-phosphate N-hydrolase